MQIIGWIFATLAIAGAVYALMSAWFAGRIAAQVIPATAVYPAVTILKPLHGDEPQLAVHLESFFRLDYPAPIQILFGVQNPDDPAIAVAQRVMSRFAGVDCQIIVNPQCHGLNAKVSNLINMEGAIRHPLVALSDADIAVAPDYLRTLASALAAPGVGAVTCLYTGKASVTGIGARLSAMSISYHFLPNVATGVGLGLASPCMGSTIALAVETLKKIGGFRAFSGFLADDYEIGRAVRGLGNTVTIPPTAVRHGCAEATFTAFFRHELRWMRTIAINDPAGHVGSIVTHPFALALIAAAAWGFSASGLWVLGATLGARAVLKWRIDRRFGAASGPLWLLPVRDVCAFAVFLVSLVSGPVEWQGETLHVAAGGILSKIRGK